MPVGFQWEDGQKVGSGQGDVPLCIEGRAARIHVGNIEEMRVGTPREAQPQLLPHTRVSAVATSEIACIAVFCAPIGPLQARAYLSAHLFEIQELRAALDLDTQSGQPGNQESLVFVLGKDQRVREWADVRAQLAEGYMRAFLACNPKVHGHGPATLFDDGLCQIKLPV